MKFIGNQLTMADVQGNIMVSTDKLRIIYTNTVFNLLSTKYYQVLIYKDDDLNMDIIRHNFVHHQIGYVKIEFINSCFVIDFQCCDVTDILMFRYVPNDELKGVGFYINKNLFVKSEDLI